MAHIGLKYPVFAPITTETDAGVITYAAGFVVGKAINYAGTPNNADVVLYADDGVAESDKSITNEGVSLEADDLSLKVYADLLGHTYTAEVTTQGSEAPESVAVSIDDVAPYGGLGFYRRRKKNGVLSFDAIWLHKVQFAEPTTNGATKADTVTFQTRTVEGTAYPTNAGAIKEEAIFTTEAAAKAWINAKAGIS